MSCAVAPATTTTTTTITTTNNNTKVPQHNYGSAGGEDVQLLLIDNLRN
jgi:hypothetical protein